MHIVKGIFYFNKRYMHDYLHICMFIMFKQCSLSPEEGIICPRTIVTGVCILAHVGASK